MAKLTDESLEFAKRHIENFYVSDFFPDPPEVEAIWSEWAFVKADLLSADVSSEYQTSPLTSSPWCKPRGGYRIVHQPDLLDCLVYTALAFLVADDIEAARVEIHRRVACAYRLNLGSGSFFDAGTGFDTFREASRDLAEAHSHVLVVDIVDFYNQIYLHRVQNAIAHSNPAITPAANDIEQFLSRLNVKVSQGLPVGPAASIVFSEATLSDVDQFIIDSGVEHTRYVDDFRIFSNDRDQLERVHQELSTYLHLVHRLSVSNEKTRLMTREEFLKSELNNPYELEKEELLSDLHEMSTDYSSGSDEVEEEADDDADDRIARAQRVVQAITSLCERSTLDLGMARAVLRQARHLRARECIPVALDNLDFLRPALNSAVFLLNDVGPLYGSAKVAEALAEWVAGTPTITKAERLWVEWLVLRSELFKYQTNLRALLAASPSLITQAQLAFSEGNVAWVRKHKNDAHGLSIEGRRALLFAARILPVDERVPWLKQLKRSLGGTFDQAMIRWAMKWQDPEELPF